jgi:lysophospholipid hydrolase
MIVRMLQYSFTISLTFPVLLSLFLASCGTAIFIIRYRYLAQYTLYKELALPLPPPPSIPTDFPELGLGDAGERRAPAFHNYLDDFLAAIRIFGYLEKPVFHELSRHLQTRRLNAGETLEIGNGDFWCVVEGKVQVVSWHSRHSADPSVCSIYE